MGTTSLAGMIPRKMWKFSEDHHPEKLLQHTVGDSETVEFNVVQGKRGTEATNVTGPTA